jgi:hypothetical protein
MHHGSYHNNFWVRDAARKKEEAALSRAQAIATLSDFQRDVVFFFAKYVYVYYVTTISNPYGRVTAKKYVVRVLSDLPLLILIGDARFLRQPSRCIPIRTHPLLSGSSPPHEKTS